MTRKDFIEQAKDIDSKYDATDEIVEAYQEHCKHLSREQAEKLLGKHQLSLIGKKWNKCFDRAVLTYQKTHRTTQIVGRIYLKPTLENHEKRIFWKDIIPDGSKRDRCIAIAKENLGIDLKEEILSILNITQVEPKEDIPF